MSCGEWMIACTIWHLARMHKMLAKGRRWQGSWMLGNSAFGLRLRCPFRAGSVLNSRRGLPQIDLQHPSTIETGGTSCRPDKHSSDHTHPALWSSPPPGGLSVFGIHSRRGDVSPARTLHMPEK